MKKIILVSIALIPILFLVTSCSGISQQEYDRISDELSAAQAQIQSLQADLNSALQQVQTLKNSLTTVQSDLVKAQEAVQPLKDENILANRKIAKALAYAEFLDIAMLQMWYDIEVDPRFFYQDEDSWYAEMKTRAEYMEDDRLINFAAQIGQGARPNIIDMLFLAHYCLGKIESSLY